MMQQSEPGQGSTYEAPIDRESVGSRVLNELLEASLSKRGRTLTAEEWFSWKNACRKSNSDSSNLEEFVVAMVEALLSIRFPKMTTRSKELTSMSRCIGQTLCGDPFFRRRLTDFREQLRGLSNG
jgi:hypothetical protein